MKITQKEIKRLRGRIRTLNRQIERLETERDNLLDAIDELKVSAKESREHRTVARYTRPSG